MHGGDIYSQKVKMDFSVNVNPYALPERVIKEMQRAIFECEKYPDYDSRELKKCLAEKYEILEEQILLGNGASEIISKVVECIRPQMSLLVAPSFSGYRHAISSILGNYESYILKEENNFIPEEDFFQMILEKKPALVFFANPSNPTGVLMSKEYMLKMALACKKVGSILLVDECFMELTGEEDCSMMREQELPIIVLNAFTKSYRMPGIRLGFAYCPEKNLCETIKKSFPEWNISLPAQYGGVAAIKEENYLKDSVYKIRLEREYLTKILLEMGMKVYPSKANYVLVKTKEKQLKEKLLAKGILIRDCKDYEGLEEGYYRFAVKTREENEIFMQYIKEVL